MSESLVSAPRPADAISATADTGATAAPPSRTWLARNRVWLLALLPLLALALVVTGWRFLRLYPLLEYVSPQGQGSSVVFHQRVTRTDGTPVDRDATIRVLGASEVDTFGGGTPLPGATLHLVTLEFEAKPTVALRRCEILLQDAAGVQYGWRGGKTLTWPRLGETWTADTGDCVPAKTPGPDVEPSLVDDPSPTRPDNWTVSTAFALPAGVRPTRVIVRWPTDRPEYALLDIPAGRTP